jgi:hypothetical protein
MDILHRHTGAVLFRSDAATMMRQCLLQAINNGIDLSHSDLSECDLSECNLSRCDLRHSDLSGCDLRYTNLSGSYLSGCNLSGCDLSGCDLSGSNLSGCDLRGSNMSGCNLSGSNLSGCKNIPSIVIAQTCILPEGTLIGWKKCQFNLIVKLQIPAVARRSNATGRKCRAEFVDVLEVIGGKTAISRHDCKTKYIAGTRVTCHEWCADRWNECAGGIHFFLTREEAEAY